MSVDSLDRLLRSSLRLRHLHMLIALDEYRNLGKVAQFVNRTQPAVSKSLAELENAFGSRLFVRTQKGTVPNTEGEVVIRLARTLLSEIEKAREALITGSQDTPATVSIGVTGLTTPHLLPRVVQRIKAASPKTTVKVEEGRFDGLVPALRAGEIDVLLLRLEPSRITGDLQVERLYPDPLCLVCGSANPLAQRKKVTWTDLIEQHWIVPPRPSTIRLKIEDLFVSQGLSMPTSSIEAMSFLTIRALLDEMLSVSVLARSVAQHWQRQGSAHILPIEFPLVLAQVGLVSMKGRQQAKSVLALSEAIREAVHDLCLKPPTSGPE